MSSNGVLLLWGYDREQRRELDELIAAWPDPQRWTYRAAWLRDFEAALRVRFPDSASADRRLTARGAAPFYLRSGPAVP